MDIQKLRELRETLGLSQQDLAASINASLSTVSKIENNNFFSPNKQEYISRIQNYLENYSSKNNSVPQAPTFSFIPQHLYSIKEKKSAEDYSFRYLGKHGRHHCFQSTLGGWTRTYTDNQLIGKVILEVTN